MLPGSISIGSRSGIARQRPPARGRLAARRTPKPLTAGARSLDGEVAVVDLAARPVDRINRHVPRTGGKGDNEIALRAQHDRAARRVLGQRMADLAAGIDDAVLENVERRRLLRELE